MQAHILQDNRVRPLVWLSGSAAVQFIAYWYPAYVARRNPSADGDGRYFILPAVVIGAAAVAIAAGYLLMRRLGGHSRISTAGVSLLACIAAVFAFPPACILLWQLCTQR